MAETAARDLFDFDYRLKIHTPAAKRVHGYYALPILHDGRLVGRLDPKTHRDRGELEVKRLDLEPRFRPDTRFWTQLGDTLASLSAMVGANRVVVPRAHRTTLHST